MPRRRKTPVGRRWIIALALVAVLGVTVWVTVRALGLRDVTVGAEAFRQPAEGFDVTWWNQALARWVRGDRVDYDSVLVEQHGLRQFAATLGAFGPSVTPARFPTEDVRLAYYINAYNALTLLAVVDNWPIASVQDVHGWLEPRPGFGFFYGLRFLLDGDETNLYDLENGVIRGFRDARIHAAINCASISCPPLAPRAYEAGTLDAQLDQATRAFCGDSKHVRVDASAREIQLSSIFQWYRSDFEEHARRLGHPPTLDAFIEAFSTPEAAAALVQARESGFEVVFLPYDWGLNRL
ncbi:MAG: DUF547 domain-containing protein [Polyangiales bacterium]